MTKMQKQKANDRIHETCGWLGLVKLKDIYAFEQYLIQKKQFRACVTQGTELLRVRRHLNEFIVVTFDERHRSTCTDRHGMVLWYDFLIFEKDPWFQGESR